MIGSGFLQAFASHVLLSFFPSFSCCCSRRSPSNAIRRVRPFCMVRLCFFSLAAEDAARTVELHRVRPLSWYGFAFFSHAAGDAASRAMLFAWLLPALGLGCCVPGFCWLRAALVLCGCGLPCGWVLLAAWVLPCCPGACCFAAWVLLALVARLLLTHPPLVPAAVSILCGPACPLKLPPCQCARQHMC